MEVLLRLAQIDVHVVQHLLEDNPLARHGLAHLVLLVRDRHVELLQSLVLVLKGGEASLDVGLLFNNTTVQFDTLGQHVQVGGRILQCLGVRLEVVENVEQFRLRERVQQTSELPDPHLAVRDEGLLERRTIDAQEERVRGAVLPYDGADKILVSRDVGVEVREGPLLLLVALDEGFLVLVPDVLVLPLPVVEDVLHPLDDGRHSGGNRHDRLESGLLIVGDDLVVGLHRSEVAVLILDRLAEAGHALDHGDEFAAHRMDHLEHVLHGGLEPDALRLVEREDDVEYGRHFRLRVAVQHAGQLLEGLLHSVPQRFLHLLVQLLRVLDPLLLHLFRVVGEGFVRLGHRFLNLLKGLLEFELDVFAVGVLLAVELAMLVDMLLLHCDEERLADEAAVLFDPPVGIFVVHHCGLHLFAVLSGLPHEVVQVVLAAHPVQFVHSGADPPVEVVDPVREEAALLGIERVEDLVVVSHHKEDVLPQDAVRFALRVDLHCDVGDFQMHPLPLVHLLEELEEVPVEVGLEQALF